MPLAAAPEVTRNVGNGCARENVPFIIFLFYTYRGDLGLLPSNALSTHATFPVLLSRFGSVYVLSQGLLLSVENNLDKSRI